jgi:hypothetical protein
MKGGGNMADKVNPKQFALTLGILAGAIHLIWAIVIGIFSSSFQRFIDWIFMLHLLAPVYDITQFNLIYAILLTILGFAGGYVSGWVIAVVWNWTGKCCKKK